MQADIIYKDEAKKLFTINEAAQLLNVHQQTLRNWERNNLIKPLRAGLRRIYTADNLIICRKIKEFSGRGVPLKGIREIITKI